MCEGGCGGEGELEGLFEEEAAEDHEVVSVSELRLHDGCGLEAGGVHEDDIVWLTEVVVGI